MLAYGGEDTVGTDIMPFLISYKDVDLVDYFAHATSMSDERVRSAAAIPKCLAAIHAFATTPTIRLGTALAHAGDDLDFVLTNKRTGARSNGKKSHSILATDLIKQVARRITLDAVDSRSLRVPEELKREFPDVYKVAPSSEIDFLIWLENDAPFHSHDSELRHGWLAIQGRDVHKYIDHWEITHSGLINDLLSDRRFVAGLEAATFRFEKAGETLRETVIGMLDEVYAEQLSGLSPQLRWTLYARLQYRLAVGLAQLSESLKAEFPEFWTFTE